jgi:glutathione S-transferase
MRVNGLAPPELYQVHPLGKSPVVTALGRTVAESSVITDFLIRHYQPSFEASSDDEDERLAVQYWATMAEGSLMGPLTMKLVFTTVKTTTPWLVRPIARAISDKVDSSYLMPTLKAQFDFIESHLQSQKAKGSDFFVSSHLTAADFMMSFPIEGACQRIPDLTGPNTRAYIQRMHDRPAYKRALEKGGEYAYSKM